MEKIRILCYGDSNTWGFIPAGRNKRYTEDERWTCLLAKKLGDNYEIIEEGLSGRALLKDRSSKRKEGKNGYIYLNPCLDTHDPIDLVILMLGTNELKTINHKKPEKIGKIIEKYYVKTILNKRFNSNGKYAKLILVAPPVVEENKPECKSWHNFIGAYSKSLKFNSIYGEIAKQNGCYFLDNSGLETGIDGIHLTKKAHKSLATKLYNVINNIYNK